MAYFSTICLRFHSSTCITDTFVIFDLCAYCVSAACCLLMFCWGKALDSYSHFLSKISNAARDRQRELPATVFRHGKSVSPPVCTSIDIHYLHQRTSLFGEPDRKPQLDLQKSQSEVIRLHHLPFAEFTGIAVLIALKQSKEWVAESLSVPAASSPLIFIGR